MPIYAYRCSNCGFQQDVLQKISDPKLTSCPNCGQDTYVKQLTAAGFQLKGSGWYATDFRDTGKAAKKDDAAPDAGKTESGEAKTGGDAAPAAPAAAPATAPVAAPAASPSPAPPPPSKPASD